MAERNSPYAALPSSAFWRSGVSEPKAVPQIDFWRPKLRLRKTDKVATAGSCFAQHIGRRLRASMFDVLDGEPAPDLLPEDLHARYGYSMYSARHGNIYTVRQFLQLAQEAFGELPQCDEVWEVDGRFVDALRPTIEAEGHETAGAVGEHRARHLAAVRRLFLTADVYVFTLGLTESWERISDGRVYPVCPGTVAGNFDPSLHRFRNLTFVETYSDFIALRELVMKHRQGKPLRFLLTVSPVPLTATAASSHVMPATTYSKSVLRAVAGQLADEFDEVDYFPSYEIITNPWRSYQTYTSNLRTVAEEGVDLVMQTFFRAQAVDGVSPDRELSGIHAAATLSHADADGDHAMTVVCDEELLEAFGPRA